MDLTDLGWILGCKWTCVIWDLNSIPEIGCAMPFSPLPSLTILGGPPEGSHIDSATPSICRSLS